MKLAHTFGRSQGSLNRPSCLQATSQGKPRYTYFSAPLRDSQSFALKFKESICPRIIRLLLWCGPPAILRKIPQIIVDAVDTIFRAWTRAHIVNEVFGAILPSFANGNTSTSIECVALRSRIGAAVNHRVPTVISRYVTKTKSCVSFRELLTMQATTALGFAMNHVVYVGNDFVAAITCKQPSGDIATVFANVTNSDKASESLAGNIFNLVSYRHNGRQIIGDNCKKWELGSIIHSVFGPPRPLTKPGALVAPPGIFVRLLPLHYSISTRVMEGAT